MTAIWIVMGVVMMFSWQNRARRVTTGTGVALPTLPESKPSVDWSPSPDAAEAYWRIMGRGTDPAMSTSGDTTRGTVGPMTSMLLPGGALQRVSLPFALALQGRWSAPRAGERPSGGVSPTSSSALPGVSPVPLPVSPAQPTPQSAVSSSSPFLPRYLHFSRAWSESRWFQPASALNAWSPAFVPGYIGTRVTATAAGQERA